MFYSVWIHYNVFIFNFIQKVRQRYELWSEDHTLEIVIDNDPSPAIELDLQEEELKQWKIYPLSSPSRVNLSSPHKINCKLV